MSIVRVGDIDRGDFHLGGGEAWRLSRNVDVAYGNQERLIGKKPVNLLDVIR